MELVIVGRGGHIRSVHDLAMACGVRVAGLVHTGPADAVPRHGLESLGVLADLARILDQAGTRHVVLAIDDNGGRMNAAQRIVSLVPDAIPMAMIHPRAVLGHGARTGPGAVVMCGAFVQAGTVLGEHTLIGANAVIGPDGNLGNFASVGTGAAIGEDCHIGSGSSVGANAVLVKRIVVGTHCVVAPGSVVLESVPDLHVAMGTPAKCVRTRLVGEPYM